MNSKFVETLTDLESLDHVMRALEERRAEILEKIGDRKIEPTPEVMLELSELNVALGDVDVPAAGEA